MLADRQLALFHFRLIIVYPRYNHHNLFFVDINRLENWQGNNSDGDNAENSAYNYNSKLINEAIGCVQRVIHKKLDCFNNFAAVKEVVLSHAQIRVYSHIFSLIEHNSNHQLLLGAEQLRLFNQSILLLSPIENLKCLIIRFRTRLLFLLLFQLN